MRPLLGTLLARWFSCRRALRVSAPGPLSRYRRPVAGPTLYHDAAQRLMPELEGELELPCWRAVTEAGVVWTSRPDWAKHRLLNALVHALHTLQQLAAQTSLACARSTTVANTCRRTP